jgi:phosphomannomutase
LALAVAHELWQAGRRGRDADELTATEAAPLHRPEVAVGRDARSSSPDIACGIVRGLRRMGCRVVDLGVISRPTLDFAVYHLRCTAGIQVTGAGSPAAVTGIDLIDAEGVPWSSPGRFDRLAEWRTGVPARPTRVAGALRNFDVAAPESVDFRRFLSGVRHMRVGLAVDDLILRRQQERWFADSGCEFVAAPFALGAFESEELPPPVRRELRVWSKSERLQFTARIAEDGRCIRLYDEQARVIAPNDWLLRIAEQTLSGTTGARLVAGSSVSGLVRGRLKAHGIELIATQGGDEQLVTALVGCETGLAADGRGRVWFADHYPLCHGFVTLTHVMRLAAESRQPVSHWAA